MTERIDARLAGYARGMTRPVTVGALRAKGHVLEVHCCGCGRMAELASDALPFDDDAAVPMLGRHFVCSRCGSKSVMTRPQVYDEPTSVRAAREQAKQASDLASGAR